MKNSAFLTLILLLFTFCSIEATITTFNKTRLSGRFGHYSVHEMLVAKSSWSGHEESFIEADLTFEGWWTSQEGRIQVFIFPEPLDYLVQLYYDYLQERPRCPDFMDPGIIEMDSSIVNTSLMLSYETFYYPSFQSRSNRDSKSSLDSHIDEDQSSSDELPDLAVSYDLEWKKDNDQYQFIGHFKFNKTIPFSSKWALFVAHCGKVKNGKPLVTMSGHVSFKNSFGHLDADLYPVMIYSLFLSMLLLLVTTVYLFLLAKFRHNLHFVQKLAVFPLLFGTLGFFVQHFNLRRRNLDGHLGPSIQNLLAHDVFIVMFTTVSRLLLLYLVHGKDIVFTRLSRFTQVAFYLFSLLYFIISTSQLISSGLRNPFQSVAPFLLSLIIPIFNFVYFSWLVYALTKSMTMATNSLQTFKIKMYTRLETLLHVSSAALLVFSVLAFSKLDITSFRLWSVWWMWDMYSYLVYIGSLIFVLFFIIRPRRNNRLLSYSEVQENGAASSETRNATQRTPVLALDEDNDVSNDHRVQKRSSEKSSNSRRNDIDLDEAANRTTSLLSGTFNSHEENISYRRRIQSKQLEEKDTTLE